jgi:two-component system cell cycle response regulator DivK
MRLQKGDQSGEKRRLPGPAAKLVCPDSGQGQEPLRAPFVGQGRSKRRKGERERVVWCLRQHGLRLVRREGGSLAKILIVEDNALNIKLFCDLLAAHGHEPEAVTDSRFALDAARQFSPDLVITDIQLPHISGLELIRMMRSDEGLAAVPIMAVTAYSAQGDEERIRAAGAQAYVSKPISVVRFAETVDQLLKNGDDKAQIAEGKLDPGSAPG